ncbi:uncharacterized protein METZ01_LOCUS509355, partial [marine metagenome]
GLSTGEKIDTYLTEQFLPNSLGQDYEEYHEGEADCKICNEPISFKTLKAAGDLALCWSKNPETKKDGTPSIKRDFWEVPMLIYVRESKQWWTRGPSHPIDKSLTWNQTVHAGFYLVNQIAASQWVEFKSNNKSDYIIDKQDVYKLLCTSLSDGLFVQLPKPTGKYKRMEFVFFDAHGKEFR